MSLRNRIFIVLIIAAVLPLGLVAATFFPFHQGQLKDRETALMEATTLARANRIAASVRGTSQEPLQQIADQLPSLGESAEILIFYRGESGRFTPVVKPRYEPTRSFPYDAMQPILEHAFQDEEPHDATVQDQRGVTTIAVARRVPGTEHAVIVKLDEDEILKPNGVLRDQFLVLSFIAIALAALLALILARAVTGPLLRLASIVATFDSEKPERIEVEGRDEVSALARSFRNMWERMDAYNDELEKAVWKRTAELEEAKRSAETSNGTLLARLEEIEKLYAMVIGRDLSPAEVKERLNKLRGDAE